MDNTIRIKANSKNFFIRLVLKLVSNTDNAAWRYIGKFFCGHKRAIPVVVDNLPPINIQPKSKKTPI